MSRNAHNFAASLTEAVAKRGIIRESRHTKAEHLPDDVRAAVLLMAQQMPQVLAQIKDLERRIIEVERIAHPFRDQVLAAKLEKVA